jgi:hypothetical protein
MSRLWRLLAIVVLAGALSACGGEESIEEEAERERGRLTARHVG